MMLSPSLSLVTLAAMAAIPLVAGSPISTSKPSSSQAAASSIPALHKVPVASSSKHSTLHATATHSNTASTKLSQTSPAASTASSSAGSTPVPARKCGTSTPPSALIAQHAKMFQQEEVEDRLAARDSSVKPKAQQKISVNVHFHVVSTKAQADKVTHQMVANQIGTLQSAYATAGITFNLASVDYTVNDKWAADSDDAGMKAALRRGTYSELNIYFQTSLSSDGSGSNNAQLLGYCTLPTNITYSPCDGCGLETFPASAWSGDGCNVHAGSMPGGWLQGYNMGKTAVHEVGHWFGLLHTFQDGSCDSSDPGDFIADTPQQLTASQGCPTGKNSCPNCPGQDPIHNYMDYSDDGCYTHFTKGQISRMSSMFTGLRKGH